MINWRSMVSEILVDRRGYSPLPPGMARLARGSMGFLRRGLAVLRGART